MKGTLVVVGLVTFVGLFAFGIVTFSVVPDVYVIKNPTQEQVEALLKGDPDNRVWFDDATQLYQGSSLIKMSFRARYFEGSKITEFLEEVGVEYELLKKGG